MFKLVVVMKVVLKQQQTIQVAILFDQNFVKENVTYSLTISK